MSDRRRYVPTPVGRTSSSRSEPMRQGAAGAVPSVPGASHVTNAAPARSDQVPTMESADTAAQASTKKRRKKSGQGMGRGHWRTIFTIAWTVFTMSLIAGVIVLWRQARPGALAVDTSQYQAVFLTSGQVYFGKLSAYSSESVKLTDVYYLQTQAGGSEANSENPQQASTEGVNVQLIKLGNEIHGPQDEMVVYKSQVLFYENLKPDSQVVKSIEQHKNSN